jgi:catechol-2,3-dioxygenase
MGKEEGKPVEVLKAHVALNVRNVAESTEFYKKMLSVEPSKVRTAYAKFNVENPPLNLTLNQTQVNERGALSHMGLQVGSTEDVLSVRERWQAAGLLTQDEMQTNCCYAIQDKAWVHDPDGNAWEVFVVLEDNLAETSACCTTAATEEHEAQISSCCVPSTSEPVQLSR